MIENGQLSQLFDGWRAQPALDTVNYVDALEGLLRNVVDGQACGEPKAAQHPTIVLSQV
jgi:hypothetical protein